MKTNKTHLKINTNNVIYTNLKIWNILYINKNMKLFLMNILFLTHSVCLHFLKFV